MATRAYDAVVIGAGLNGLTAAILLARAGRRTLVLERRAVPGGLAATEEFAPGFRCDAGPNDPGWLAPGLVKELGLDLSDAELVSPDPALTALLPGGGAIRIRRDVERTAAEIAERSERDGERWPAFARRMTEHAGALEALYAKPPPRLPDPRLGELGHLLGLGLRLRGMGSESMTDFLRYLPMSVTELLEEWFEDEALKGTLGFAACRDVFQGPRSAGTGFGLLHGLVGQAPGVFGARGLVRGGGGRLARAMAACAEGHGAEIRYRAAVREIRVEGGRAEGVVLEDGGEVRSRSVVSGADPGRTFLSLTGRGHLTPEFVHDVRNIRFRGARAKVHLALDGLPAFRGVEASELEGIVTVAPDLDRLERAYDDGKYGRVSAEPHLSFTIPTLTEPSLAPAGRHVLSAEVRYAPYRLANGGWNAAAREALGDRVVSKLAAYAPGFEASVLHREVLSPVDLEGRFGTTEGAASHGELALDQILFMRPLAGWSRYATPIEGLFLCGRGTHPGPGIVGGSGRLAAGEVLRALRS